MVVFLSDTHLGSEHGDKAHATELRVTKFLRNLPSVVSHIYMLGDMLDYWFEYRTVVPRGFVRFFGELARLSDSGVRITWLTGNHDIWLFDYLRDELGIEVVDTPYLIREIMGKTFLLAHGDRIGHATPGFKFISHFFRNRLCQRLFAAIHPGITVRLAHAWSAKSRRDGMPPTAHDVSRIIDEARALSEANPEVDFIIEGHHHLPLDVAAGSARLIVLGDWAQRGSFASFDGERVSLVEL